MSDTGASLIPDLEGCPCAGVTLDRLLQPAILALLAREPLHGYRIAQALAETAPFQGHAPDSTGIYRLLKSLEERGMVSATWDLSDRGPARRLYHLTPAGEACLRRWVQTLEQYQQAIGALLGLARRASQECCDCCCESEPPKEEAQ